MAPEHRAPTLPEIEGARQGLGELVRKTPTWQWQGHRLAARVGWDTKVFLKLELFQHAGSFKPRGALTVMKFLSHDQLANGVTAVSAGNHAMAVAYGASVVGTTAKVVMMKTANPVRVRACREMGAEVVLAEDVHKAFVEAERLQEEEGRFFVHPFEGPLTALGTATLALEFLQDAPDLDAVIVPIGGGGLCAGVSAAVKQIRPQCLVIGVEPHGADSMHRSFAAGEPRSIERVATIADSLGAPYALPYSFALCRRFVDELVKVDDDGLCDAMALLFQDMKLAVEPAGAAATAALVGPLADRLRGKRVGLVVCGANIDAETFQRCLQRANAGPVT